jgi:hypothetical protein
MLTARCSMDWVLENDAARCLITPRPNHYG